MDPLLIALRVAHIVGGVFWAGGMLFVTHFLEPAVRDAGPDGAKVMQALQKRRVTTVMPAVAVATLVSGFWLYYRTFGRVHPGPGASGPEMWLGIGGFLSLVAFVVGLALVRPSAARVGALGAELAQAAPERREVLASEVARLRRRMRLGGRIVVGLLTLTMIGMAVGRYS
jgi:uncharacterized membrane protein